MKYFCSSEFGCALLYFTGSAHFNRSMRALAHKANMALSHHSLNRNAVRVVRVNVWNHFIVQLFCVFSISKDQFLSTQHFLKLFFRVRRKCPTENQLPGCPPKKPCLIALDSLTLPRRIATTNGSTFFPAGSFLAALYFFHVQIFTLIELSYLGRLIDWLIDWLVGRGIHWLIDWLIDWFWLSDWLIDWLICMLHDI